ncbi:hypothetical protein BCR44DRAFT_70667 [Catenaria anguillulae PL171]|uniref:Uncharacterized protein n=1 Tax=Catenaria anguillulae PL171 TaxID=765915 RepID=A0A1Y2I0H1_9FUNG|nr:hypothetical protein BCR44DRAFT_70667 [Catenaria anguillulae PL171]
MIRIPFGSDADDEEEEQLAGEYDDTDFTGLFNYRFCTTSANDHDGDYTNNKYEEEQDDDQNDVPHDMPLVLSP